MNISKKIILVISLFLVVHVSLAMNSNRRLPSRDAYRERGIQDDSLSTATELFYKPLEGTRTSWVSAIVNSETSVVRYTFRDGATLLYHGDNSITYTPSTST